MWSVCLCVPAGLRCPPVCPPLVLCSIEALYITVCLSVCLCVPADLRCPPVGPPVLLCSTEALCITVCLSVCTCGSALSTCRSPASPLFYWSSLYRSLFLLHLFLSLAVYLFNCLGVVLLTSRHPVVLHMDHTQTQIKDHTHAHRDHAHTDLALFYSPANYTHASGCHLYLAENTKCNIFYCRKMPNFQQYHPQ